MVNGCYEQICVQFRWNDFDQINFATGEAGGEMQKTYAATREPGASS